jgi:hypothetical protein
VGFVSINRPALNIGRCALSLGRAPYNRQNRTCGLFALVAAGRTSGLIRSRGPKFGQGDGPSPLAARIACYSSFNVAGPAIPRSGKAPLVTVSNRNLGTQSMSFLQRFLPTPTREETPTSTRSSFLNVSEEQLEAHLNIARYGNFMLTDAVRPSYDLQVVPSSGYRHDVYQDADTGIKIPVLMGAASSETVLDLFLELLDPLGNEVDMVLETSHERNHGHLDLYRENIDAPVLKSTLYDFENLLLNDGCLGIAVLNPRIPFEVQFDEHKLLIVYGKNLSEFEEIFKRHSIDRNEEIRFITEAEHVHSSSEEYFEQFQQLRYRLGIDE